VRRHVVTDHEPHNAAETALPHALFNGLEKILGLQFLDGDVGIARDMERMRFDHIHAAKQGGQVSRDHLFQPDKCLLARRALAALLARPFQRYELRQGIRHLHAREVFHAILVANQHRQVQAQVGYVGERTTGIESQGREHRKSRIVEIRICHGYLLFV
jgi:hypothetical protein